MLSPRDWKIRITFQIIESFSWRFRAHSLAYNYLRATVSRGFRKHKDLAFKLPNFDYFKNASTRKWLRHAVEGKELHDFVNRSFCYPRLPRVAWNLGYPYSIIVQINNLFPDKHRQWFTGLVKSTNGKFLDILGFNTWNHERTSAYFKNATRRWHSCSFVPARKQRHSAEK